MEADIGASRGGGGEREGAMDSDANEHVGWSRGCVNVRLTKDRLARLRAVAAKLQPGRPPTDAIDAALELAIDVKRGGVAGSVEEPGAAEGLAFVERAIERIEQRRAGDAAAIGARLALIERGIGSLAELISAVAASGGGSDDGFGDVLTLRRWLDAHARKAQTDPISALAKWQSKSRSGDGHVSLELLVKKAQSLGAAAAPSASAIVRLDRIDVASPLARTDLMDSFLLVCARGPQGEWRCAAHQHRPDGGPGPLICIASV